MGNAIRRSGLAILAATIMLSGSSLAREAGDSHDGRRYQVTITNVTKAQIFTPILVASHRRGVKLFELGQPAGSELELLAEGGDTGPLAKSLKRAGALDVVTAKGLLLPGATITLYVKGNKRHDRVSVASMLIPTNDTFLAVNGVRVRRIGGTVRTWSPGYDAGTEENDELCASIPGPACGGEGHSVAGGEGYVYVSPGIQGVGDLTGNPYDWRNPVARITIKTVR